MCFRYPRESRAMTSVRALGGGPLLGDKLVRIVYVDETGHSAKEPVVIVAGLILDPDKQWRELADRIRALVSEEVPEEFRPGFIFHATDLMYGGRYRRAWADEARWATLEKLLSIPRELRIPVCLGLARKPIPRDEKPHRESVLTHVIAYALCMKGADRFMVDVAAPNEVAMVVAEHRKEAREHIEKAHYWLTDEESVKSWLPSFMHADFPITRIKAPPAFASKQVEPLLQIADACAFVLQRYVNASYQSDRFLTAFLGNASVIQSQGFDTIRDVHGYNGCLWWPDNEQADALRAKGANVTSWVE